MKSKIVFSLVVCLAGSTALANFSLSKNDKAIVCFGEDNQTINLNRNRTRIKYTVEGESLGRKTVVDVQTDNESFVTYTTSELSLTLSDSGDTFKRVVDDESQTVDCK